MNKIKRLQPDVIARIAAGEVIERPVYAVKELVENALDAQADTITILIEESGLKKIVVTDNGEGMGKDDLLESFRTHTTSKLDDDTLTGISTLGFRGEALASIAAVSDMTLQSRVSGSSAGEQVVLRAGRIERSGPVGMPPGTTITVNNLFYTVPTRKKFLKSPRIEFAGILNLITQYAFAYPSVRFTLIHNKRQVLDLPKSDKIETRVQQLLGSHISSHLMPVKCEESYISVSGYIAKPQISTRVRSKQYLFINNRAIDDKRLATAVKESFGNLLESSKYPVFILYLDIPYEAVDVNVHPRKEQVSFINPEGITNILRDLIKGTLANHNLSFEKPYKYSSRAGSTETRVAHILKESTESWNVKDPLYLSDSGNIQQINKTYVLAQTQNGLVLIDQHAAHERILYEQYMTTYKKRKQSINVYTLSKPLNLELSLSDVEQLTDNLDLFDKYGFDIERTGESNFRIKKIPEIFKDYDLINLISELVEDILNGKQNTDIDSYSLTMISFLACKSAIKAGDILTGDEAGRLIKKLEETERNATCPHGRPTKIIVTLDELNKWFKRT